MNKTIYTFTNSRMQEFKSEKRNNEVIASTIDLINFKEENFDSGKQYYFDLSNLYISCINNPIKVEEVLNIIINTQNFHAMINTNLERRFQEDFSILFDKFEPINNIYVNEKEFLGYFYDLEEKHFDKIENDLKENLIGHIDFKKEFMKQIKNFPVLYKIGELKIFSVLLCGDSGIGKTEFARILHKSVYGDNKMIKINLGNYKSQGSLNSLIGSPKGYYGSERGGELSNKIKNSNSKVIIIDEFDKGDTDIFNFFYELLEDGKFTDLSENEFVLDGYVIIFTTNLKKNNYKEKIPLPLLSRFTMKYEFEKLSFDQKKEFIKKRIKVITEKYNNISKDNINENELNELINYDAVMHTENLRGLNKIIINSLLEYLNN